jgi:hypothetical protein
MIFFLQIEEIMVQPYDDTGRINARVPLPTKKKKKKINRQVLYQWWVDNSESELTCYPNLTQKIALADKANCTIKQVADFDDYCYYYLFIYTVLAGGLFLVESAEAKERRSTRSGGGRGVQKVEKTQNRSDKKEESIRGGKRVRCGRRERAHHDPDCRRRAGQGAGIKQLIGEE